MSSIQQSRVLNKVDERQDELVQASELFSRTEPDARSTQLTRNQIAKTALSLADSDGIEALSMRRLSEALDVGTMTLYSYIRNKDELLMLLSDEVMRKSILQKNRLSSDWKESLVLIAGHTRKVFRRHPWVLDIQDDNGPSPNSIKHYDRSLQAIAHLDISLSEKADILAALYNHIFGYCAAERHANKSNIKSSCIHEYLERLIGSGDYPALEQICEDNGIQAVFSEMNRVKQDPKRFERNLVRLLNGFDY